ncbi:MAG: pyridine nucleotide-disulfide oxidoreductase [Anaerosolibacter sp.]|jgi:sarcosine oxidase subunit alpha|uniref:NAD(P)/FAD-dependent oxidoreductase n=1 Tax=Anaerosolibacter sp. TaxID=1872527 RepID=UPI002602DA54|nr:NAD(P)/FAD-dependent oxidoreductase [Anaerosolibacter sp.]MDF2547933.1 pyridine nucleotide-disulfide oxidoreductase [Anaerosolibacter sp.]
MKYTDVLIIGGGPAGLCAAISAAEAGCKVLLVDRNRSLGGQLVKQTHMFFGSEKQYASVRGIDISKILLNQIHDKENIEILNDTTILGIYEDGVITAESSGIYMKIKVKSTIVATGASEKTLAFPNNDLPGVYGAGAVQTLMNEHGIKPGKNVLMVGAGNIGLIVSYQLLQAGVKVAAIIDAAPNIGGYLVHASKVRRSGVPIYTRHTVKQAYGKDELKGATIHKLDENWNPIEGTEMDLDIDVMCIAVGLSPLCELLWQAGCEMKYMNELGGYVPLRNERMETSIPGIFVAGDVGGVEEASSAMVEGYLAGINAAQSIGHTVCNIEEKKKDLHDQLHALRSGPVGTKIREGITQLQTVLEAAASSSL